MRLCFAFLLAFAAALTRAADLAPDNELPPAEILTRSANVALAAQDGNRNFFRLEQAGANGAYLRQAGDAQRIEVVQSGVFHTAHIEQLGVGNTALLAQSGARNTALIGQNGQFNSAEVRQSGSGLNVAVQQYGDRLSARVIQH
jgi:minor curlin subunit